MLRLLLYIIIGYFGYHFFKGLFSSGSSDVSVKGESKKPPLDLKEEDIEDAKYKDVEE